jgi:hypothetical protein
MPHLNIYVGENLLRQIKTIAKIEKVSMSKLIQNKISNVFSKADWPENYFDIFGSLDENDLKRPEQSSAKSDIPRESL